MANANANANINNQFTVFRLAHLSQSRMDVIAFFQYHQLIAAVKQCHLSSNDMNLNVDNSVILVGY